MFVPRLSSAVLILSLVLTTGLAHAIVEPSDAVEGQTRLPFLWQVQEPTDLAAARAELDEGWQRFLAEEGGRWWLRTDARTGRPSLIQGSGLPWIPGKGNDLTWEALGHQGTPDRDVIRALLETKARELLASHPDLFRLPAGIDWKVDADASVGLDDGRTWQLSLKAHRGEVPVERAGLVFRLSHGNLVQLGSAFVADELSLVDVTPELAPTQAFDLAFHRATGLLLPYGPQLELPEIRDVVETGRLHLVPVADDPRKHDGRFGEGLSYRLTYEVIFRLETGHETWTAEVDARTGEIVALFDGNHYACPPSAIPQGRVTGGVFLGPIEEVSETVRGMPETVVEHGGTLVTDLNGLFPSTPGTPSETGLNGFYFDMNCVDCVNPPQVFARNPNGGNLFLGFGGNDEVGNGTSTPAERNCYYHLALVRQLAGKHLDDADTGGFLTTPLPANVNIDSNCNAFFDGGSVNFYRAGGGCNNTGTIADVMQHEWGHGIDRATGNAGDGARGEGLSDVVAWLSTHDSNLGPYFNVGVAAGIRNADEAVFGLVTLGNLLDVCPGGTGPAGGQVHCEGVIFSQTFWRMKNSLIAKYGEVGGWHAAERLFFQSLPISDTYIPDQMTSVYDAVVLIDDDNGDLADGVPNGDEINEAFLHHEIASMVLATDSGECAPPTAPPITLVDAMNADTGLWQVQVSWTDVPGAVEYLLVRNDSDGVGADIPVARFAPPATSYLDDNITDGVDYRYRIIVLDAGGCTSINDDSATVSVGALPNLAYESYVADDFVGFGNGNGVPEPGEVLDLTVGVVNASAALATGVSGTLSSTHPGVRILTDTASYDDLDPFTSGTSLAPFVVELDPGLVSCGDIVTFEVQLDATDACSDAFFSFTVGQQTGYTFHASDDMEVLSGWTVDPDGTDDATEGIWEWGDPHPTNRNNQPADDHTPHPGTQAWITGNVEGAGQNDADVDGGCTTLQSPVYDMGGRSGTELVYWLWYNTRQTPDDMLLVEITNDGGMTWSTLDTHDGNGDERQWLERRLDLDTILGEPADMVAMKVHACDVGDDSRVEVLIDDFVIRSPVWTCEAAAPRPRLDMTATTTRDDPMSGAAGNDNGLIDPGESVKVTVDVENTGNADATTVTGLLTVVSAPPGTVVSDPDGLWPDVGPGMSATTGGDLPEHFEITLPEDGSCGETVELRLDVTYDGPADSYSFTSFFEVFVGLEMQVPIFFDDLEVAANFASRSNCTMPPDCNDEDDWQQGIPGGLSPFDPTTAWSGESIWGNDLSGFRDGDFWDGNYAPNIDNYLEARPQNCAGFSNVHLSFRRWLSVLAGDRARILVNGTVVWSNADAEIIDTEWVEQVIDISAIADDNPAVSVRFELAADDSGEAGGWNLDDVSIFQRDLTCETYCTAAAAPAPAGPVLRAGADFGLDRVQWDFTGLILDPGEAYVLRRGTNPAALDVLLTPDDHVDPTWTDTGLTEPLYFYLLSRVNCAGESLRSP
ncbi:MAG: hypothetical protein AAF533_10360 [Acidobacteriota bacterium]